MKLQKNVPIQFEFYVVIFLFLVIICISIFGNKAKISPFNMSTSLSPYPYREGFSNGKDKMGRGLGIFEAEGLKASSVDQTTPIHDPMSALEGKTTCVGASSFSNSLGGLCLTADAKRACETRGGNFS